MNVNVVVVGTAQPGIEQEYWHDRQFCNEIFFSLQYGHYEEAWLSSITLRSQTDQKLDQQIERENST